MAGSPPLTSEALVTWTDQELITEWSKTTSGVRAWMRWPPRLRSAGWISEAG